MKLYKKRYLLVVGLILIMFGITFFILPNVYANENTKGQIAYVDVWTVFNIHPKKNEAEEKLNQLAQDMQAELQEKAKDLPSNKQQELLKEYQAKLSQQEQEMVQTILDTIRDVIKTVAEDKEVKIVLDKKNVIYGGYDLTQDVIDYIKNNLTNEAETNNTENAEEE